MSLQVHLLTIVRLANVAKGKAEKKLALSSVLKVVDPGLKILLTGLLPSRESRALREGLALLVLSATLSVCGSFSAARAQEFWNSTRSGMKYDDVKRVFPTAVADNKLLKLQSTVLGHPAEVDFVFDAIGLIKENVIVVDRGEIAVQEIKNGLTQKFGPSIGCQSIGGQVEECRWKHENTTITTNVIEIYGSNMIGIVYELGPLGANNI